MNDPTANSIYEFEEGGPSMMITTSAKPSELSKGCYL